MGNLRRFPRLPNYFKGKAMGWKRGQGWKDRANKWMCTGKKVAGVSWKGSGR